MKNIPPLEFEPDPQNTTDAHVRLCLDQIDRWVKEIVEDRADDTHPVTADECYSDVVDSYIAAEVGYGTPLAKEINRRTGTMARHDG